MSGILMAASTVVAVHVRALHNNYSCTGCTAVQRCTVQRAATTNTVQPPHDCCHWLANGAHSSQPTNIHSVSHSKQTPYSDRCIARTTLTVTHHSSSNSAAECTSSVPRTDSQPLGRRSCCLITSHTRTPYSNKHSHKVGHMHTTTAHGMPWSWASWP